MSTYIAAILASLLGLGLTTTVIRGSRLIFRLGWFQPLYKSVLETKLRHLKGLWDAGRWTISDDAFCMLAALPTTAVLLRAALNPANRSALLIAATACLVFAALAACDRRYKCLPNPVSFVALGAGLFLSTTPHGLVGPSEAITGAIGTFLFITIPCAAFTAATGRVCLGPTDQWLVAAIGAFLGWQGTMIALSLGLSLYVLLTVRDLFARRPADGHAFAAYPFGQPAALGAAYVIMFESIERGAATTLFEAGLYRLLAVF